VEVWVTGQALALHSMLGRVSTANCQMYDFRLKDLCTGESVD